MIHVRHLQSAWIVIVEPDTEARLLVVVTVHRISRMTERSLQVTYRKGRPFAAYLHLSHATGEKSAKTIATPDGLLVVGLQQRWPSRRRGDHDAAHPADEWVPTGVFYGPCCNHAEVAHHSAEGAKVGHPADERAAVDEPARRLSRRNGGRRRRLPLSLHSNERAPKRSRRSSAAAKVDRPSNTAYFRLLRTPAEKLGSGLWRSSFLQ